MTDTPTQAEAGTALAILNTMAEGYVSTISDRVKENKAWQKRDKAIRTVGTFIAAHPDKPKTPPVSDITEIFDTTGIEGFGASYWRHDDAWHFYSMPGSKGLSLTLKGSDHSKIEYIIKLMRKGLESSKSPDKPAQPDLTVAGERQPEGWRLVPIEPTEEMVEDGEAEIPNNISGSVEAFDAAKCVYRAMLAAAPVPTVKDNLTVEAPGHTDLMVPPETIDAFMVANPLPYAWVIPGDDNAKDNGYLDAMAWREGEFTKPLYDRQPAPVPPSPGEEGAAAFKASLSSALLCAQNDHAILTAINDLKIDRNNMRTFYANAVTERDAARSPAPETAQAVELEELRAELETITENRADQNRMVDRIADLIGLPQDQELDTVAFELWFSDNATRPPIPVNTSETVKVTGPILPSGLPAVQLLRQLGYTVIDPDTGPVEFPGFIVSPHTTVNTSETGKAVAPKEGDMQLVSLEKIFTEALGRSPLTDTIAVSREDLARAVSELYSKQRQHGLDTGKAEINRIQRIINPLSAALQTGGGYERNVKSRRAV